MKYTIKGITDRVITFNNLGLTIRGNSNNLIQFPHSIARGIEIETDLQWNEINGILKAGFVVLEPEQEILKSENTIIKKPSKKKKISNKIKKKKNANIPKNKQVKRIEKLEDNIDSEAVMLTSEGVIAKGKMIKNSDFDLEESDITKASIDAAKKIEEEERIENEKINEEKLDISERMGNDVVISGNKKSSKTKIKKSIVSQAKTNWIDFEKSLQEEKYTPFIDKTPDLFDKEEKDDRFIE